MKYILLDRIILEHCQRNPNLTQSQGRYQGIFGNIKLERTITIVSFSCICHLIYINRNLFLSNYRVRYSTSIYAVKLCAI